MIYKYLLQMVDVSTVRVYLKGSKMRKNSMRPGRRYQHEGSKAFQGQELLNVSSPHMLKLMPKWIPRRWGYNLCLIYIYIYIWVCLKMLAKPLNPMVLLIIIPFLNGYFIGNIPYFQTNPYIYIYIYICVCVYVYVGYQ